MHKLVGSQSHTDSTISSVTRDIYATVLGLHNRMQDISRRTAHSRSSVAFAF